MTIQIDLDKVKKTAEAELEQEMFREAVDKMKEELNRRKWWHTIFPYTIKIIRRD